MANATSAPGSTMNAWRLESTDTRAWERSVRAGDSRKLLMLSADTHANEPHTYLADYIEPAYRDRIPYSETREDGSQWLISEGNRPQRVKPGARAQTVQPQQSFEQPKHDRHPASRMDDEDKRRNVAGRTIDARLADQHVDGVDAELIYPNKGLLCWATPDPVFAMAMCRAWNRWALDHFRGASGWSDGRTRPLACIASGDQPGALEEIRWAAENDFVGVCFGNAPIYGPKQWGRLEYNDESFEAIWSLVAETGLPVAFHVSTGRDPRAVGGKGGAITNYVCHSMETTIEPLVQLITSGVFERHPKLRAGMVESGIGFVPWLLETMDHAHRAHHFFVRPVLPDLPSDYYRHHCFATFQEDHVGLRAVESERLVDNTLWANDYPHHEGTWPHSEASIQRQMNGLSEDSRAKSLGLNAARIFGISAASLLGSTGTAS